VSIVNQLQIEKTSNPNCHCTAEIYGVIPLNDSKLAIIGDNLSEYSIQALIEVEDEMRGIKFKKYIEADSIAIEIVRQTAKIILLKLQLGTDQNMGFFISLNNIEGQQIVFRDCIAYKRLGRMDQ
jgi:hypothetical protein